jgi:membrane fusion protein (multidrug efflux system)
MALDDPTSAPRTATTDRDEPSRPAAAGAAVDNAPPDTAPPPARQRLRVPLLIGGLVVALAAALYFYLQGGRYESTDNAYLQSGLVAIAANVSGPVIAVEVRENQPVKRGQLLFRIDPEPYATRVAEAEAALAQARTDVLSMRADFRRQQAEIAAARDRLDYAEREAARQQKLLAEGISSQNQYDQARLAAQNAEQAIETSRQQGESVRASLAGDVGGPVDAHPRVRKAIADLARARLDLGYTDVRAPQDGIVTKVNQLQVGSYVTASRPVFTLAGRRLWVEANFKEDQLTYMRVGQKATVEIDAYPDMSLHGHVASFSPGTGNSFALLPPENATGNWVKVVQRLPVQIELDDTPMDEPLHAGLSAEVTVDTGHKRHLFTRGRNDEAGAAAAAR